MMEPNKEYPKLRECPFCGAKQERNGDILRTDKKDEYMHWNNGCILGGFKIKDIEAWNRRAT